MSVRVWAELVIADPVTLCSPVFVIFSLVKNSPFSWFGHKISHVSVVVGRRSEDLMISLLNLV